MSLVIATYALSARAEAVSQSDAGRLFTEGVRARASNNDQRAYTLFSEAWSLHRNAETAMYLADVESRLGLFADAANHYSFALDHPDASVTDSRRGELSKALSIASKQCGTLRVATEPVGAEVFVDGQPYGVVDIPRDVYVEPGEHKITAKLSKYEPQVRTTSLEQGETKILLLSLAPLDRSAPAVAGGAKTKVSSKSALDSEMDPRPDPSQEPTQRSESYVPALVAGGVGVAALGVSLVTFIVAHDKDSTADDERAGYESGHCAGNRGALPECDRIESLVSSAKTLRIVSLAGLGVAGAAGIATFFLWPREEAPSSAFVSVTPRIGAGAAAITIDGLF